MAFCKEMAIELPDSFPINSLTAFKATGIRILPPFLSEGGSIEADESSFIALIASSTLSEFLGATNLIAWRYRACAEYCDTYISSWQTFGPMPNSHEEGYQRQRALFGMFVSGVSCIESACYAIYAIASSPKVLWLPFAIEQQKNAGPRHLYGALKAYAASANAAQLVQALRLIKESDEWKRWIELRNRMAHRTNIPHYSRASVFAGDPKAAPDVAVQFAQTSSTRPMEADDKTIASLFSWLRPTLESLLEGGRRLALG
jgi:hypothetical protein